MNHLPEHFVHMMTMWRSSPPTASTGDDDAIVLAHIHIKRSPLRELIPRLLNEGSTAMTACCAPACSQALPVKPQGVWARGIEA